MKSVLSFAAFGLCLIFTLGIYQTGKMQSSPDEAITQIMFNSDGSRIGVATENSVRIYDSDFVLMSSLTGDVNSTLYMYSWHPDSKCIFISGEYYDSATLTPSAEQDEFTNFSPDGRYALQLATDETGGYLIYDTASRTLINRIGAGAYFEGLTWSKDGAFLAAANGREIIIMDVLDANRIIRIPIEGLSFSLTWNPINHHIAATVTMQSINTGSPEQTITTRSIQVFDIADSTILHRIEVPGDLTEKLYWTPDGKYLISQTDLNVFSVWDTTNAYQPVESFTTPELIGATALSPYGGRLLYTNNLSSADIQSSYSLPNVYLPVASTERLGEIIDLCDLSSRMDESLSTQAGISIQAFVTRINALSSREMLPGCRADLLAVAAALQAQ
jgi:WD40 repeat protein